MFEEEIVVALLVSIFALCLHYYIGTIDLWYMPALEICIALVFYELIKAMYNSYKTFDTHSKTQEQARQDELSLLTDINTLKNKNIPITTPIPTPSQSLPSEPSKNITFKKDRYFRDDDNVFDNVEVTTGDEEVMSETSNSYTEENV